MSSVRLCVHRAADAVGGNCIEIVAANGERILLDAGRALDTPVTVNTPAPCTLDFNAPIAGILLSHAHVDHYGMLESLPTAWPIYCGQPSGVLLRLSCKAMGKTIKQSIVNWKNGQPIHIGSFIITPRLIDHSAFDSYALQIGVNGKSIFYSGDFRTHGRKGIFTRAITDDPPSPIDVLIMEGTNLASDDGNAKPVLTERALEKKLTSLFKETKGRVFVSWAATNIDRTVTLYRACLQSGRILVPDLYGMLVLMCLGEFANIPQPGWQPKHMKAVVTSKMMQLMKRMGENGLVNYLIEQRAAVGAKALKETPEKWVIMARDSLVDDYRSKGVIPDENDVWVWSLWMGYLATETTEKMRHYFAPCRFDHIHTSGHASAQRLLDFAFALKPKMLIPVHGENWRLWASKFPNCCLLDNGQWLDLA